MYFKNIYVQINILVIMGSLTYNVAARFLRISKVNVQNCARFYTEICVRDDPYLCWQNNLVQEPIAPVDGYVNLVIIFK